MPQEGPMKSAATIAALKKRVLVEIGRQFELLGLVRATDVVYWLNSVDTVRIAAVSFLGTRQAAYFKASTASFGIEFGALYDLASPMVSMPEYPAIEFCQLRGLLLRSYKERAPDTSLPAAEHKRRDIWWIDASGEGADRAISDAARAVREELGDWLNKLVDYPYLWRHATRPHFRP